MTIHSIGPRTKNMLNEYGFLSLETDAKKKQSIKQVST